MRLAGTRVTIVAASGQNVFFEDLEQSLVWILRSLGADVRRVVDRFPEPEADEVFVFFPHEYYALTTERSHPTETHLARTIALATEQPGTARFDVSRDVSALAAAVLDINPAGVRALRAHGIAAEHLPLACIPEWDAWKEAEGSPRPTDVLFLGGWTARRELALAICGEVLSRHRCHIQLVGGDVPFLRGAPGVESGAGLRQRLATSKVLLNVHRSTEPYFEWHRGLLAMVNGCVVVTEHASDLGAVKPGTDLLCSTLESLPHVLEAVLRDHELRRSLQRSAVKRVKSERSPEAMADVLARAVEHVLASPVQKAPPGAALQEPSPRAPPARQLGWERARERTDPTRLGIKLLLLGQRELARRIERLERNDADQAPAEQAFGPYADTDPEVSVVLTVFNYADVVAEAIESVARADHDRYELVVVDDASRDDSLSTVTAALEEHPWLAAKLVRAPYNLGLPAARNLGLRQSRGDLVFVLDADNAIYPQCLEALARPFRDDPGLTFAYGIIERYDAGGPAGLVSWHPWDPDELRHDNFIDAMAMLRRRDLLAAGGYTTDSRLHGWEDFELWCRFADRGLRGVQVPNVLARYRSGRLSMQSITNIDTIDAWSALVERYAFLTAAPAARRHS